MQVSANALARLSADPGTVKGIQRRLGLPETGMWDDMTDSAFAQFQQSAGRDVSWGLTGNANEWQGLDAALSQRAPEPGNPAMQDAAYAAYLRQMGVQQANIRNEIQARTEAVQRAINRNAAGFEQQKAEGVRNAGLGWEDRGLFNSGLRQQDQAKTAAGVDYQRQQSEADQTDALATANRQAQNSLSDLAQKRAEEELNARTRIGQKRAQQVYNPMAVV